MIACGKAAKANLVDETLEAVNFICLFDPFNTDNPNSMEASSDFERGYPMNG
jgi:hypothetical protein